MDQPLEASDEASSESDFLDKSLSMWSGWNDAIDGDVTFDPIPLDLHTAAYLGDFDYVKELLDRPDTDPNRKNRGEWTPLMYASYIGHDNVVNLLLDAKVDVNMSTESGTTPLMLAASCGNESVACFLHQNGADIDIPNERGWTALFHATYSGHLNVVQFLSALGADFHRTEFNLGVTPLMLAAAEGHERIVNYFLEKGVDVTVKNKRGDTARSLAMLNGNMKVVSLIDNRNIKPSTLRSEPDLDLSSSDESFHPPSRPHHRKGGGSSKVKGPSIQDGPAMFAKLLQENLSSSSGLQPAAQKLSPSQSREPEREETNPFCISDAITVRSSGGSSCSSSGGGGLAAALGLSREGSISSNDGEAERPLSDLNHHFSNPSSLHSSPLSDFVSHLSGGRMTRQDSREIKVHKENPRGTPCDPAGQRIVNDTKAKNVTFDLQPMHMAPANLLQYQPRQPLTENAALPPHGEHVPPVSSIGYTPSIPPLSREDGVRASSENGIGGRSVVYPFNDLQSLLEELKLSKYFSVFEEQDVDLRVFLTLTDSDLKEVGIKLMGPRRKMTNAIARWHSEAKMLSSSLEQVYADKMETALQEMAVQYQEMSLKKDELEAQLLQEKELRSVVEGCLVEDRKTYQQMLRLVTDTRSLCHRMREMYDHVRFYQSELLKRLKEKEPSQGSILLSPEKLAENLQIGLMLDAQFPPLEGTSPVSGLQSPPSSSIAGMMQQHRGGVFTSPQPIAGSDRKVTQDSAIQEQLQMDLKASTRAMNIQNISMEDLMSHLGQMSHQMARVVAKATNNMDQLLEGQTQNFSPNSSGNSLP